jgi:dipeptidase E
MVRMTGPIVAIGGAEFQRRPENEVLHDYIVSLVDRPSPKICLLPTASGDPQDQIAAFYGTMERRGCVPSAISLFRLGDTPIDFAQHLLAQDAIYVTGGSMVNLLALWREHGIDEVMKEAHARGILLCGYSAGSMCWFESGISRGGGAPAPVRGLGLIEGSHCVHYSQDPARRDAYRHAIADGRMSPGIALDDHAAALISDGQLVETVRSRETASAFKVERTAGDRTKEIALQPRLLPMPETHAEPGLAEMREIRRMRTDRHPGPGQLGRRS